MCIGVRPESDPDDALMRWRGLEPPRPKWPLGPQPSASTNSATSARSESLEKVEQHDRVDAEDRRDDHGESGEVPLDDVRPALGMRSEAEPAHAGLASRVHEDERDEARCEEYLEHGCDLEPRHGRARV